MFIALYRAFLLDENTGRFRLRARGLDLCFKCTLISAGLFLLGFFFFSLSLGQKLKIRLWSLRFFFFFFPLHPKAAINSRRVSSAQPPPSLPPSLRQRPRHYPRRRQNLSAPSPRLLLAEVNPRFERRCWGILQPNHKKKKGGTFGGRGLGFT